MNLFRWRYRKVRIAIDGLEEYTATFKEAAANAHKEEDALRAAKVLEKKLAATR